jgi:hypothetical protein
MMLKPLEDAKNAEELFYSSLATHLKGRDYLYDSESDCLQRYFGRQNHGCWSFFVGWLDAGMLEHSGIASVRR